MKFKKKTFYFDHFSTPCAYTNTGKNWDKLKDSSTYGPFFKNKLVHYLEFGDVHIERKLLG